MSNAKRQSLDEPSNGELIVFIQPNSHLELRKIPNILLHLERLLAKGSNLEVELLLIRRR